MEPATTTHPPRPKRLKPGHIVLIAVGVLVIAGVVTVKAQFDRIRRTGIRTAVSALEKSLHARIAYQSIRGDIRHQLGIDALSVKLESGDSLYCARVGIDYDIWQLIRRKYIIRNLEVTAPRVTLARTRPARPPAKPGAALKLAIGAVRIVDGAVGFADQPLAESLTVQLSLTLDSSLAAVRVQDGTVRFPGYDAGIRSFSGSVALRGSEIDVESLALRAGSSRARLDLQGSLADSLLAVRIHELTLDAADLAFLPALESLSLLGKLSAQGDVQVSLKNRTPDFSGRIEFRSPRLGAKGIALGPLDGDLDLVGTRAGFRVAVRDSVFGSLDATGHLDLRTWEYGMQAGIVDLAPASLRSLAQIRYLPRTITGLFTASGQKLGRAHLRLDARVTGLPVDTLSFTAQLEPNRIILDQLEVRRFAGAGTAAQSLRVKGTFTRSEIDAGLEVDRFPIAFVDSLLSPGEARLVADVRLSGKVDARGPYRHPAVRGEIRSETGQVAEFRFASLLAKLDVPDLSRVEGSLDLQISRPAFRQTEFERLDAGIAAHRFSVMLRKDARLSLAAGGTWSLPDHAVTITCTSFTARNGKGTLTADRPFELSSRAGRFALTGFEAAFADGTLALDAAIAGPAAPEVSVRATGLDLNLIGRLLLNTDSLRGKLDLALNSGDSLVVNGGSDHRDWQYVAAVSARGIGFGAFQAEIDRIYGRLAFDHRELYLDNLRLVHGTDTSSVSGSVGYRTSPRLEPGALNIHAKIADPGPWVLDFLRGSVNVEKGSIFGDATITGTFDRPQLTGALRLFNGEIWIPGINQRLTDVTVQTLLDKNRMNFAKISGASGDGSAIATGYMEFDGFRRISDLQLNVHATGIEMQPVADIVGVASGDVKLHWADHQPLSVTGQANVSEALVAIEFGNPSLSNVPNPAAESLRLDLTIKAERNVWVRNRLLDMELAGDLSIRKPGRDVLLSGEMTTRQGRVYAFDHSFLITQGAIRFDNPGAPDPSLDITAELPTRIRDSTQGPSQNVKIIASITGTASRPELTIASDPAGMTQADIATYLTTNILPEELASLTDRQVFSHLVSDRLLNLLSREVTSRLQSFTGLDVLQLDIPSAGSGVKLTVSKYVGKNLFLSYTASTTQLEPDAFKAEYFFSPGRELIGERQETGTYSLRYQFRLRY